MFEFRILKGSMRWIAGAAFIVVGQTLVLFVFNPSFVNGSSVVAALIFSSLMLAGSRLAWTVILIGAGGQIVNTALSSEHYWALIVGACVFGCLLAPSSIRSIWTQRQPRRGRRSPPAVEQLYDRVKAAFYRAFARIAAWEDTTSDAGVPEKRRSYRLLIWRLGISCVVLLVLVGVTYNWQHGSGHGNPLVSVIASTTWACYVLVQLAFILVSLIALHRRFSATGDAPGASRADPE